MEMEDPTNRDMTKEDITEEDTGDSQEAEEILTEVEEAIIEDQEDPSTDMKIEIISILARTMAETSNMVGDQTTLVSQAMMK